MTYSVAEMKAIGGVERAKAGRRRIYFDDWRRVAGIGDVFASERFGPISSLDGKALAAAHVERFARRVRAVYWDVTPAVMVVAHTGSLEFDVEWLDGTRATVDLFEVICRRVDIAVRELRKETT